MSKDFRKRREMASVLLSYAAKTPDSMGFREAMRVYKLWLKGKISYADALRRIKKLAGVDGGY